MHPEFWHARWQEGQLGFHRDAPHDWLDAHWSSLDLPEGSRVLVPLCGKSLDLLWLRDHGHEVYGVELSGLACEAVFTENDLPSPLRGPFGPFQAWRGDRLVLLQGNIHDLPPDFRADAIWDRAATVALPGGMRDAYAHKLAQVLAPGAPMFVVTLDYPQDERDGPPFAVSTDEMTRLYAEHFDIVEVDRRDPADLDAQRAAWGLSRFDSRLYRLTRR